MTELQNPEFWVGLAFCLVVLFLIKPLKQKLSVWGEKRAEEIKHEFDESASLRKQAEDLYAEYKTRTKNLDKEYLDIVNEGKKEAVSLQQQADDQICERLAVRQKEVKEKVQMIEDSAGQDITNILLKQVISKTREMLEEEPVRQSEKEIDAALEKVFKVLEKKYN